MIPTPLFFIIGFSVGVLMLSVAYFLQYGLGLEPCPLCILARIMLWLTVILYGIAALHAPKKTGMLMYSVLSSLSILGGLGVSARHLYLQRLPAHQIPDCGPGFDYLIRNFPLSEVFSTLFHGSGQCAQIGARFMGFALSEWTALGFFVLLIWNILPFFGIVRSPNHNINKDNMIKSNQRNTAF